MRRTLIGSLLTIALVIPVPSSLIGVAHAAPEACVAANPGVPTCTLKITSDMAIAGAPTGMEGMGDWQVVIKRGKKKILFKFSAPVDGATFVFKPGDVVTATANTPGSWAVVGHTS